MKTIGRRIFRIRPLDGLVSQTSSAAVILAASVIGAPASTTQVVSSSVVGGILLARVTTFPPPPCWRRSSSAVEVDLVKRSWFLPENPDVLGLLCQQARITQEGMVVLCAWTNAEPDAAQRVREWEHKADDARKELRRALTIAFTTPVDAEDIYVMSERPDAVLNGAKDLVREAEVMGIEPDEATAAMAGLLADGVREVIGRRELYRRFSRVSETLIEAADRVWYATVKEGDRHANRECHDQPGGHRRDAKGPR